MARPSTHGIYIYAWFTGDILVYIGKGGAGRAWTLHPHNDKADSLRTHPEFRVEIIEQGLDRLAATQRELYYIRTMRPTMNVRNVD